MATRVKYVDLQGHERVTSLKVYEEFCSDLPIVEVWDENEHSSFYRVPNQPYRHGRRWT